MSAGDSVRRSPLSKIQALYLRSLEDGRAHFVPNRTADAMYRQGLIQTVSGYRSYAITEAGRAALAKLNAEKLQHEDEISNWGR